MGTGSTLTASGYDPAIVQGLPARAVRRLTFIETASLLSAVAMAASLGYAVFVSFASSQGALSWALVFSGGALGLLVSLQKLSVCLMGPGLIRGASTLQGWRPSAVRVLLMLVLGAVAAQPLLLASQRSLADEQLATQVQDLVRLQVGRQQQVLVQGDAVLRMRRAQLAEQLATLEGGGDAGSSAGPLASTASTRKALLIGAQQYQYAPRLNNPARDVEEMAKKLDSMGFSVSSSIDEAGAIVQTKLIRFFDSLRPGDISLIYYSGHGYQKNGHNYLVPVDFHPEQRPNALRMTRFLDAVDRRSPQLQVVILDACRTFETDGFRPETGGLAELQGGTNSFIAMAAKPGMEALDGPPGSHGVFTGALLRHLDRAEDINTVFRRAAADARAAALAVRFDQQPVITSTLTTEYVQLMDPLRAAPDWPVGALATSGVASMDLGEALSQREPTQECATPTGLSTEAQRAAVTDCLRAKIAATDRTLEEWQLTGSLALREYAREQQEALLVSGLFTEKLRLLWSLKPFDMLLGSILLALLLAAGEGMRRLWSEDVALYVRRRHEAGLQALQSIHERMEVVTESVLAQHRNRLCDPLNSFRSTFTWSGVSESIPVWAGECRDATEAEREALRNWLQPDQPWRTSEV